MQKITDFIVDHCYIIFVVFLIITGICGFLATKVQINKDIYSYMPADSETSLGLSIMKDEFDYGSTSSYEIMLTNVDKDTRSLIKEYIESIDGVESVNWNETDEYVREPYTRYQININAPADSENANRIYQEIHKKYDSYNITEAGQVYDYNGEVLQISVAILAVACAMVILLIMCKSWVEPWLFLFSILLAVVMNMGTNIIFSNVSHITNAIVAILQMALSMDYAIMLSTRYRQEKTKNDCPDKQTAMHRAMHYSFGAISSSSATTIVGLIILVFMSFTIGRDMGLVLSKGVILSLVSIFTSLPALLLLFDKAIEKTEKKTLNIKMNWFGKQSYRLRHFALPLFLFIFIGSFLLRGSTAITFTANQNNEIKEVFDETNQMALVYDAKMDEKVTRICQEYDSREDTIRVLCYGNTINEPEKYNEIVPKANEFSDETITTDDYLIKALYYHYYRDIDSHTITLPDFVNFLQTEVFPNQDFAKDIASDTVTKVDRFSNFVVHEKVNRLRTKDDIANILGIESSKLDDIYTLYFANHETGTQLTLYQFAQFVTDEILTNPQYATMISPSEQNDLAKLRLFADSSVTDTPMNITELANLFSIDQSILEQLLVYYNYLNIDTPSITATIEELISFALSDETILNELNISSAEAANIKAELEEAKSRIANTIKELSNRRDEINEQIDTIIANLPEEEQAIVQPKIEELRAELATISDEITTLITKEYSYDDFVSFFHRINLDSDLTQLKNIYKLYQAKTSARTTAISPRALVTFLLAHANDDKLSSVLDEPTIERLKLVQYIMDNQNTRYTAYSLAATFNLDIDKLKLVFALYYYRYINNNPLLSLKTLIEFIDANILTNPEYTNHLNENEQTQLFTITTLMHAAENGVQYSYKALYRAVLPLSSDIDQNQLFLAYLYHGSLYDYDESWTLTLETFINYLPEKILPDTRFSSRIDDEMRQKILDGRTRIMDAKELLVSPKHYRALFETHLDAEGKNTFAFIKELKDKLGPGNKTDYFLVGDSAMAYEMSQTFSDEMNFITILTMLSIFAVVVCTFKSLFVSLLLVLVIQCAVFIVMAYLSITGSSIYFIALIIVQAILMGATIDYAILFTSYYVENRNHFKLNVRDALIATYNKSINAILTSASVLIIVTTIVGNLTSAIAGKICQSISLGTFCSTIIILLLLPALLATLDKFIIKKNRKNS